MITFWGSLNPVAFLNNRSQRYAQIFMITGVGSTDHFSHCLQLLSHGKDTILFSNFKI